MTNEELIAALRMRAESELCRAAADRIEALVRDKRWIMEERDRTFALMLARAERLAEALRLLHDNVVLAFPTLADLGPVANARAALITEKPVTEYERKVAQMREDFPNGI